MPILAKTLQTLEFPKVQNLLAQVCMTEGAKQKAAELLPMTNIGQIRRSLTQTDDAKRLVMKKGQPAFGNARDITEAVHRAQKGAALSPRDLLAVLDILQTVQGLISYGKEDRTFACTLDEIFERLLPNRFLQECIARAIPAEDMIADEASPELSAIRRKMRAENAKIRETLQKYITGNTYSKYLQENIITMRNGRYVIPVKAEHKNDIRGLVHDTSSSGATLFIEPMAVVEANNNLAVLATKEQKEIERVLAELSALCAEFGENLIYDYLNLTELAFLFGKAALSFAMDADSPHIVERGETCLVRARHPLLPKKSVVPITVRLGGDFDTLVVTGPNTGGKTVTLKTVGLLTLMAQSGLHIPASAESSVRVFRRVFADIGDEQSIEQSLSTFSAHMVNIVAITEQADADSLVLFDELGAGTDPVEGAALAVAVLEYVRERGSLCIATTHYAELKAYALQTPGVMNASCEFDVDSLRPTYHLVIGAPGRSNAFAISKRLGLRDAIIARADAMIGAENKEFETVIAKLDDTRTALEKERAELEQKRHEYETLCAREKEKLQKNLSESEAILEKAQAKATRILESARASSDYVLSELDALRRKKDSANFKETLAASRDAIRSSLKEADSIANPVQIARGENYTLPRLPKIGETVYLRSLGKPAQVTELSEKAGTITVLCGNLRTRTKLSDIMLAKDAGIAEKPVFEKKTSARRGGTSAAVSRDARMELDLRGETGEDGWLRTDKYLDEAILSGMHSVTLIHGKGTGALRRALWGYLKTDPRVKSFRAGQYGEGDAGVTIVELK